MPPCQNSIPILFEDLENAATTSRLTHDKMTIDETKLFPDIPSSEADLYKTFLYIRNKIVCAFIACSSQMVVCS